MAMPDVVVSVVAAILHWTTELATSATVIVWAIMTLGGTVVERLHRSAVSRSGLLNLMYAPVYLVADVALTASLLALCRAARERLGFDPPFGFLPPRADSSLQTALTDGINLLLFVLLLDGLLFAMHWLQHRIPLLWSGHRLHHSDPHVDVTTTARLHVLDLALKAAFIAVPFGILIEPPVLLNTWLILLPFAWGYYIHLDLPLSHGRLWWLVTSPQYHLLHHEKIEAGIGCNFAPYFPLWDIVFGTCVNPLQRQPKAIGLTDWEPQGVGEMIRRPANDAFRQLRD